MALILLAALALAVPAYALMRLRRPAVPRITAMLAAGLLAAPLAACGSLTLWAGDHVTIYGEPE